MAAKQKYFGDRNTNKIQQYSNIGLLDGITHTQLHARAKHNRNGALADIAIGAVPVLVAFRTGTMARSKQQRSHAHAQY